MHPCRKYVGFRFFLKYSKVVKTIVRWLRTFVKMCTYVLILFYVDFKAMIAMWRNVFRECLSIYIYISSSSSSSSSSSFHYSGATTEVMSLAIICSFNVHAGYIALQHQPSNSPDSPGKAANVIPKVKKGNPQPPHR